MSANSSSSNGSVVSSHFLAAGGYGCYVTHPNRLIFITFTVTQVSLLSPLCVSILYLGLQQPQQSHSDRFTYHMVVMEIIGVFGCVVSFTGICMKHLEILKAGLQTLWFTWYGQISFHTLTCAERHLAVVHPVAYLGLKSRKGARIRNAAICCAWLLCFVLIGVLTTGNMVLDFSLTLTAAVVIVFFSVSVLCVLIRPGPGERANERADQSKHRAFCVIVVILGFLMLRLLLGLAWVFLDMSGNNSQCLLVLGSMWISLPSSFLLPLLYLQRAGKLVCFK